MAKDRIPTSRVGRTARVGRLAATQAVRQGGTRVANLARGEEASTRALERRHVETAEQIVTALGTMKGAAMKLGQVLSFLDVGLVPEEYREEFQRKLGALRDAAPKVRFKDMRKVIESELEDPLDEVFDDFQEEPIAAASIGQVYRARLPAPTPKGLAGRDVAVKVQYPRVAEAVRADMANLGLILRLLKRMAPGLDVGALADEVRKRINEELDYELEAQNQRALARIYRGHPFIVVPAVVTSLSRERVMVSEYVQGTGFEVLKGYPQEDRNRIGEIVFRFYLGCLYRHHEFSGDPHPGNFLLLDDDRVAFLDFGLFKRMQPEPVELELASQRAVVEDDREELHRLLAEAGFLPKPELVNQDVLMEYARDAIWWYTTDEEIELTPEVATSVLIESSDPRSSHYRAMRHQDMRPEHVFGRRMEMLTLAVLGQLRASANWHRIAREWMYGDPPVTELGRAEAAFYAGAPA
jgi:predicted unusual protein kinase regulating ubiquinone biosynthesis (AarF/ABC1/UbiB family)